MTTTLPASALTATFIGKVTLEGIVNINGKATIVSATFPLLTPITITADSTQPADAPLTTAD